MWRDLVVGQYDPHIIRSWAPGECICCLTSQGVRSHPGINLTPRPSISTLHTLLPLFTYSSAVYTAHSQSLAIDTHYSIISRPWARSLLDPPRIKALRSLSTVDLRYGGAQTSRLLLSRPTTKIYGLPPYHPQQEQSVVKLCQGTDYRICCNRYQSCPQERVHQRQPHPVDYGDCTIRLGSR